MQLLKEFIENQEKNFVEYDNSFRILDVINRYVAQKKYNRALAWADLHVSLCRDSDYSWQVNAYEQRATVLLAMGEYANAINDHTRAIELESKATYHTLEYLLLKRGYAYLLNNELDLGTKDICAGIVSFSKRNDFDGKIEINTLKYIVSLLQDKHKIPDIVTFLELQKNNSSSTKDITGIDEAIKILRASGYSYPEGVPPSKNAASNDQTDQN